MDAWETLLSGSTIAGGDAWEHLNAQGGGGSGETQIIYVTGGLSAGMNPSAMEGTMQQMELSGVMPDVATLSGKLRIVELAGEIDVGTLSGILAKDGLSGEI